MPFTDQIRTIDHPHHMGSLILARVLQIYPIDMCVDVIFLRRGDFTSSPFRLGGEGQLDYKVPVMQNMAGSVPNEGWLSEETEWGKKVNLPLAGYGTTVLPRVGDYVVVGFLNEDIHRPVVLGSIHPTWREMNTTGKTEDLQDTEGPSYNLVTNEQGRYLTVFPSMVWWKINEQGEIEISLPMGKTEDNLGGTFIKIGKGDILNNLQNISGNAAQLKSVVSAMKTVIDAIQNSSDAMDIINDLINNNTWSDPEEVEEACKELREIKEIKMVLDGDPRPDEEASDGCGGGCCCGPSCAAAACDGESYDAETHTNSNCSCGASWDYVDSTYVSSYDVHTCGGS